MIIVPSYRLRRAGQRAPLQSGRWYRTCPRTRRQDITAPRGQWIRIAATSNARHEYAMNTAAILRVVRRDGPLITALGILTVVTAVLRWEGRLWWCVCGMPSVWIGDAWGPHTSQHLFDPYSLTHV